MTRQLFLEELLRMKRQDTITINGEQKKCKLYLPPFFLAAAGSFDVFEPSQLSKWWDVVRKHEVTDVEFPRIVDFYLFRAALGLGPTRYWYESDLRKAIKEWREIQAMKTAKAAQAASRQPVGQRQRRVVMIQCSECGMCHDGELQCWKLKPESVNG